MLAINSLIKIYLHAEPVDMRKSFDGLFGIIKSDLHLDVRDGGVFMFLNLRRNRIKLMHWDRDDLFARPMASMSSLILQSCYRSYPASICPASRSVNDTLHRTHLIKNPRSPHEPKVFCFYFPNLHYDHLRFSTDAL